MSRWRLKRHAKHLGVHPRKLKKHYRRYENLPHRIAIIGLFKFLYLTALRVINSKSMDMIARHEFFKRMAATGDTFKFLSLLDDEEVAQIEAFLQTLSFE